MSEQSDEVGQKYGVAGAWGCAILMFIFVLILTVSLGLWLSCELFGDVLGVCGGCG